MTIGHTRPSRGPRAETRRASQKEHVQSGVLGALLATVVLMHQSPASAHENLFELSLEELMEIEIASISKKNERLRHAPAAAYVITGEDIQRSGARSLPEALRLAPGVEVARINGGAWAIAVRGFNGRFTNKLLVMLDGRSLYTPFFSGVDWEKQLVLIEDIERIEVVRGPGAAIWGPNAMNGVINIITRTAKEAEGVMVVADGSLDGDARLGGSIGQLVNNRLAVKMTAVVQENAENQFGNFQDMTGANAGDVYSSEEISARLDGQLSDKDDVSVIARYVDGKRREARVTSLSSSLQYGPYVDVSSSTSLQGKWARSLTNTLRFEAFASYEDARQEESNLGTFTESVDISTELHWEVPRRHALSGGVYYQYDNAEARGDEVAGFTPLGRKTGNLGAFIHTEWRIWDNAVKLVAGSTFEDNDYSGFEYQPTLRASWKATPTQTIWGGVSRSVRTPSRVDWDLTFITSVIPANTPNNPEPLPLISTVQGVPGAGSETLYAYEFGYRVAPAPRLSIDIATFYKRYTDLVFGYLTQPQDGEFLGVPASVTSLVATETIDADTYGGEVFARWAPLDTLRLNLSYSYLQVDLVAPPPGGTPNPELDRTPEHQLSLQSYWNVTEAFDVDVRLGYRSEVDNGPIDLAAGFDVSGRLGWRPRDNLELSLIGEQLNDESRTQFIDTLGTTPPTDIERRIFARVKVSL